MIAKVERALWVAAASIVIVVGLIVAQIAEVEKRIERW